ncbi:uncharacterized protein MKZ38_008467 [Zalerion maritima]|uniref:NAD(+) diphosphatase n=1 Tax=Zalerion maritima TaxID=339359 RepID=A0AAD5WTC0_9PEZI|nr:uncharacterized protein MKZ38_008467 [Zalerion maritima]
MADSAASLLFTRRYGAEVAANYFSGSPLNRVAFLRGDHEFLQAAFCHASAAIVPLDEDLHPLVLSKDGNKLDYVTMRDVKPLLMSPMLRPFAKSEKVAIDSFSSSELYEPLILFLGLDEGFEGPVPTPAQTAPGTPTASTPGSGTGPILGERKESSQAKNEKTTGPGGVFKWKEYQGRPYFALHVAAKEKGGVDQAIVKQVKREMAERGGMWLEDVRKATLEVRDAAIYGLARHLVDWNLRNTFCATCGSRAIPVHGGWKRACPPKDNFKPRDNKSTPKDNVKKAIERPPCSSRNRVSNVSFPRTDPTVIAAVINSSGTKILLGRQKQWVKNMYSTLAGFVEPGESLEEAVKREVWEESGVTVGRVQLHSSQPWPFPGGLMVGAVGVATEEGEIIHLGHDPELEDARWFGREEVEKALKENAVGLSGGVKEGMQGRLRLPPTTAIANRLISSAVGFVEEMDKGGKI